MPNAIYCEDSYSVEPAKNDLQDLEATVDHEAGHAVVAWRVGIALRRNGVTIVPEQAAGIAGCCFHVVTVRKDIEVDRSDRNRLRVERRVQVLLAGEIAQRRYNPRSVRTYHARSDLHSAVDLLSYFFFEQKELEALLKFLHRAPAFQSRCSGSCGAIGTGPHGQTDYPGERRAEIIRNGFDERLFSQ